MDRTITLADLLVRFRDIMGDNQKEVAEELDLPAPSLSFYENGKRTPPFRILIRLLEYYDARLSIETDLGEWVFEVKETGDIALREKEKSDEIGLLSGLNSQEKEDLIAYIRRRRRHQDGG